MAYLGASASTSAVKYQLQSHLTAQLKERLLLDSLTWSLAGLHFWWVVGLRAPVPQWLLARCPPSIHSHTGLFVRQLTTWLLASLRAREKGHARWNAIHSLLVT